MNNLQMKSALAALVAACAFAAGAGALDRATIKGVTDRDPCSYKVGEKIVFTFSLDGAPADAAALDGLQLKWSRRGDDGVRDDGAMPLRRDGMTVVTSLGRPGFLHLEAWVVDAAGEKVKRGEKAPVSCTGREEIAFTGGAGAELDRLTPGVPEPADFNARWKAALKRLFRTKPVNRKTIGGFVREAGEGLDFICLEVEVPSYGPDWTDCWATGYLTMPKNAQPGSLKARVSFDGYGIYPQSRPWGADPGWIDLHVNAHGIRPLTLSGDAFAAFTRDVIEARGSGYGFNDADNADFEKAYFFGMAMRAVSATTFLHEFAKTRPEWDGRTLVTTGGSQGGLQATWAAAFVKGVSGLRIHVPWCCDLGGIDAGRLGGWRPRRTEALGYFDPVNVARRLRPHQKKEIFRSALGDYIAPPSTHAVLYNAMRGDKTIEFRQGGDHYDDPKAYSQNQTFAAPQL